MTQPARVVGHVDSDEGQVLARFPRKRGAEEIRFGWRVYQGRPYLDCRLWWRSNEGEWRPGSKGFSIYRDEVAVLGGALFEAEALAAKVPPRR